MKVVAFDERHFFKFSMSQNCGQDHLGDDVSSNLILDWNLDGDDPICLLKKFENKEISLKFISIAISLTDFDE